ncbi:MAG: hypothetical protein GQ571_04990 [Desulfobacterales bacterium]|nr:hypothetical protein [Desulfobacterales bacterium]
MKRKSQEHHKSAILILEEAVHLLRKAPLFLLSGYYIGTLPFILGLFYFWADMSRSADAKSYHAVASLGIALLYIWMKCWHVVFAARVKMSISGQPVPRWSLHRMLTLVTTQTLIHATAFFILPLAALVAIPFGWCYAFYQNITAEAITELDDLKTLCQKAWFQAKLWPRQNHMLLAIIFIFGVVVFLNLAGAIYILPHLLKKYIGVESMFTLSGSHVINTTFWVVTIGISYLCMNPLVKTVYALRCFYGAALKSGDDLKTELKGLMPGRTGVAIGLFVVALFAGSPIPSIAIETHFASPEALDRSIDEVMERREFTWRMPRELIAEDEKTPKGPIASVVAWIIDKLGKGIKAVINWVDKLMDWLIGLLPAGDRRTASSNANWITSVRVAVFVLLIGILCALVYILWRSWMRRQNAQAEIVAAAVESTPNLENDDTAADDLPVNRWLELARELTEKGSWRLAIRAFYLATLANLAENELITIEKFKSNREYENELHRRAHQKEALLKAFSKSREVFERVWYGMYEINRPDLDHYAAIQKRMMTIAQS